MDTKKFKKLIRKQRSGSQNSTTSVQSLGRQRRGGLATYHFRQEKLCNQLLRYAKEGNVEKVKEVLDGGVDIEEIDQGVPALVCASGCGYLETVAVLLRYGAQVNSCDDSGCAPIHVAARKGHCGTIALLLSRGANVDLPSKSEKRTALHLATLMGHDDVAKLLLDNHAKVDHVDIYGSTPLHLAARMGRKSTVQLLIQHNADVSHYDNDGWTALHLASETGNLIVLKYLLDRNAQIDSRNKYGRTPLHWAACKGNSHIVQELLLHKADANIKDFHGKKPINYATSSDILKLLKPVTDPDVIKTNMVPSIGLFINIDPRNPNTIGSRTNSPRISLDTTDGASSDGFSPDNHSTASGHDIPDGDLSEVAGSPSLSHSIHRIVEDSDTESTPRNYVSRVRGNNLPLILSSASGDPTAISLTETPSVSSDGDLPLVANHRNLTTSTKTKINEGMSNLREEIRNFAKELSKDHNAVSIDTMALALANTQKRLRKMENALSNMHTEFKADIKTLEQSTNNVFNHFQTQLESTSLLPQFVYQGLLHGVAKNIAKEDLGWQKVIKNLETLPPGETSKDDMIQDILTNSATKTEQCYCASLRVSSVIAPCASSAIKDTLDYLEGCDLENYSSLDVVTDCLQSVRPRLAGKVLLTL